MIERIPFLTPQNQEVLLGNLYNIMFMVMPLLLIWLAFQFGGTLIEVIRNAFSRIDRHDRDEDYEKYDD